MGLNLNSDSAVLETRSHLYDRIKLNKTHHDLPLLVPWEPRHKPRGAHGLRLLPGIYTFGLFATDIFVNAGQVVTGNLAPHFLALCRPNYTALGCQQLTQFISGEEACTGDPELVLRARKTFPSKEAALSVYAAVYLTMYITSTVKAKGTRLAKPVLCLGLLCSAFLTGLNRVAEHRNHWSDVIAGFLVGTSIAVFLVVCVVSNFRGRHPESEHARAADLAHTPMISIPRVESPLEKGINTGLLTAPSGSRAPAAIGPAGDHRMREEEVAGSAHPPGTHGDSPPSSLPLLWHPWSQGRFPVGPAATAR
ncbi:PREDICTED: lipid phosphate phosphatase-related protein type 5 [Myotis brandtii]|uniref:lipid phosphate phosphatase-related protein type 5 n=1 Tax=Myotis brandtii TaxID=109478 RepID=UPI0003BBE2A8|nr:PREDICTED: lipid phosphate phosphatase-related protein type 5 [Myotis brandtii]